MNLSAIDDRASTSCSEDDISAQAESQERGTHPEANDPEDMSAKLRDLPKDVGVMLVAVGAAGMVLPGMMGGPAILAGGLVLWPKAFGRVESWFGRTFPRAHREGMKQIGRYLNDLDKRYSYTSSGQTNNDGNAAQSDEPAREMNVPRSETR